MSTWGSLATGKGLTYNPSYPNNTAVRNHLNRSNRCSATLQSFDIIGSARNDFFLKIKETLLIKKDKPTILNPNGRSVPLLLFDWSGHRGRVFFPFRGRLRGGLNCWDSFLAKGSVWVDLILTLCSFYFRKTWICRGIRMNWKMQAGTCETSLRRCLCVHSHQINKIICRGA